MFFSSFQRADSRAGGKSTRECRLGCGGLTPLPLLLHSDRTLGSPVTVSVLSNVATGVIFIIPNEPRQPPSIKFTRSGNHITVSLRSSTTEPERKQREVRNSVVSGWFGYLAGFEDRPSPNKVASVGLVRGPLLRTRATIYGARRHLRESCRLLRVTVFDGLARPQAVPD